MSELLNRFAPNFTLPAVSGARLSLSDFRGQIIVLTFWSAGSAWSRRADVLLVYRMPTWEPKGVRIVGVASNFSETDTEILHEAERRGVRYPVLLDMDQSVANTYRAQTTPHFFIIDRRGVVRYTGALDDASMQKPRPKVLYVDLAVNALLENKTPDPALTLPYGNEIARMGVKEPPPKPPAGESAKAPKTPPSTSQTPAPPGASNPSTQPKPAASQPRTRPPDSKEFFGDGST